MKDNKNANHNIKCDVESCKHNDTNCNCCDLNEISVSCNCSPDCACKSETICDSFEENENNSNE